MYTYVYTYTYLTAKGLMYLLEEQESWKDWILPQSGITYTEFQPQEVEVAAKEGVFSLCLQLVCPVEQGLLKSFFGSCCFCITKVSSE